MTIETLDDLFVHTLKDVLYAEHTILNALPIMERKATDPKLKAALSSHRDETEDHVVRLEEAQVRAVQSRHLMDCPATIIQASGQFETDSLS